MAENTVRKDVLNMEVSAGVSQPQTEHAMPKKGANTVRRRNVLGRGLSALMSTEAVHVKESISTSAVYSAAERESEKTAAPEHQAAEEPASHEGGLVFLSIDRLVPNRSQPRQFFPEREIESLSQSIRDTGLLQPIIVRRVGEESGQLAQYEIVAGERRFRAARRAGLSRIPAILRQLNDKEALELGIIENVQRENLNPIEEAKAFYRLITEHHATQEEVAEVVGKDRVSIANALRLLKLPQIVQEKIISGVLSSGHGRALLRLESEEAQIEAAEVSEKEGLSVRALESLARSGIRRKKSSSNQREEAEHKPLEVQELEERLRRELQTKVALRVGKHGKGELRISFFSKEELERIIDKVL